MWFTNLHNLSAKKKIIILNEPEPSPATYMEMENVFSEITVQINLAPAEESLLQIRSRKEEKASPNLYFEIC